MNRYIFWPRTGCLSLLLLFAAAAVQFPQTGPAMGQAASGSPAPANGKLDSTAPPASRPMTTPPRNAHPNLKSVESPAPPGMVIDGRFDEWTSIPAIIDDGPEPTKPQVDFRQIKAISDERFVHLMFEFTNYVTAQGLEGVVHIMLDVDGDPKTGKRTGGIEGIDAVIELSPPNPRTPDRPGMGIGLRSTLYQPPNNDPMLERLNPYDIGLMFSPTHHSPRFEFRMDRNARLPDCPPLFAGETFTFKMTFSHMTGGVMDEVGPLTVPLTQVGPTDAPSLIDAQTSDPLARPEGTVFRAMSWNIKRGAMLSTPEPFARTLRAIDPDVILLQELTDKNSASQIKDFLTTHAPLKDGREWNVAFGSAGGDLRCAIAAKYPVDDVPALSSIVPAPEGNRLAHPVRTSSVRIRIGDKSVLLTSLHLKCCGNATGPEDRTRIRECKAIHTALRSVLSDGTQAEAEPFNGMIIAGDFNLVGSRTPLNMLCLQLDLDKTVLSVVEPYQLDGLSNVSWADRTQPFTPGRLDFMLYSDSTLKALRGFTYESTDLSPLWLQNKGVQADDSAMTSDHLPVVADFAWETQ